MASLPLKETLAHQFDATGPQPAFHDLGPVELVSGASGKGDSLELAGLCGSSHKRTLSVLLLLGGTARLQHYGRTSVLSKGDFVLINTSAPYNLRFLMRTDWLLLRVAPIDLRAYLPSCEHLCGLPLRSTEGISQGAAGLAQSILEQLDVGIEPEFKSRIGRNLLDTVAMALAIVFDHELDGSPIICDRNARVRLYIERNLRDPDLKPSTIATNLRISSRYMRVIFAASKETVSAYILRRRLEECARDLADPALNQLSITEIAFSWGFNSGPHFTRSFRKSFSITPREHRSRGGT